MPNLAPQTRPQSCIERASIGLCLTIVALLALVGCFSDQRDPPPCGPQTQYEDGLREVVLANAELPYSTVDSLQAEALLSDGARAIELVGIGSGVVEQISGRAQLEQLRFRACPAVIAGDMERLVSLPNLKWLDLSGCSVDDGFLTRLEGMPALEDLRLGSASLTLVGMQALAKLTTLRRLDLSDCGVAPQWLSELAALPNLEYLNLKGNQPLSVEGLSDLRQSASLRELDLSAVGLTNAMLAEVSTYTNLSWLNLSQNSSLTQQGISVLAAAGALRALDVSNCGVNAAWLPELANLTQLEELRLGQASLSDAMLVHLGSLANLRRLDLSSVDGIGAPGMLHVRNVTSLESLDLRNTPVGDAGLGHLRQLTNLRRLLLSGGYGTVGMNHIASFPSLRHLELHGGLDSNNMVALSFANNLRVLRVWGGSISDDDGVMFRRLVNLRRLYFRSCNGLSGQFINTLVSSESCLEWLSLDSCTGFSVSNTGSLPRLRNLTRLSLTNGTNATGLVIRRASQISTLERLDLEGAVGAGDDSSLRELINAGNLQWLKLSTGRNGAIDFLRNQRPAIAIRHQ